MNMIVNSSDLVGYEAETKIETKEVASKAQTLSNLLKVWERKQFSASKKAAGFGFLAVSLAACNSEDTTPFNQADVTAAEAAATATATTAATTAALAPYTTLAAAIASNDAAITTAALTHSDGTVYTTIDAAKTAGINTSSADAIAAAETAALTSTDGTVHATVDAAMTSNDAAITAAATTAAEATLVAGTGFASVSDLNAAYTTATSATAASYTLNALAAGDAYTGGPGVDTITGTSATMGAADIIVGGEGIDSLTINATAALTAPTLVTGVENVVVNLSSFAAAALDVDNIDGYTTLTFNNTQTSGLTTLNADNVQAGSVVIGTGITGDANLDINGAVTLDGGGAGSLIIDLGNITTGSTITANSVTGGTGLGAGNADIEVLNMDLATINSTTAAWIIVDGDANTTDAVTISGKNAAAAGSTIGLETIGGGQQVEILTLSGNGGAATFALNATGDAPESITLTGDQNVQITLGGAQIDTETVIDTTAAGASATVGINVATANINAGNIATSVIVDFQATTAQASVIDTPNNANYKISADAGALLTISSDATASNIGEVLSVELASSQATQATVLTDFETLNVSVTDSLAAVNTITLADLNATATGTVFVTGDDNLTLTASNTALLNATGFNGKLTASTASDMLAITGGNKADTVILAYDGAGTFALDGGPAMDTLSLTASKDVSGQAFTMSNFETIAMTGANSTFKADSSDATGKSWIITGDGNGIDQLSLVADGTTIDMSSMTIDAATVDTLVTLTAINQGAVTVQGSNAVDTIAGAGAGAVTVNGYGGADVIPTAAGADIIDGGAGADNIDQGAGNDIVTGGEGADNINTSTGSDTINLGETVAAEDVLVIGGTTNDVMTVNGFDFGGTATDDDIEFTLTTVEAYTGVTQYVNGAGTDATAAGHTLLKVTVAGTDIGAADNTILTIDGDYATPAILATALETGGSMNLVFGAWGTAGDFLLVAYDDGVNSKIATLKTGAAIANGAKAAAGDLTVVDRVILNGVADATSILLADFDALA